MSLAGELRPTSHSPSTSEASGFRELQLPEIRLELGTVAVAVIEVIDFDACYVSTDVEPPCDRFSSLFSV